MASEAARAIEAILMVAVEPVEVHLLAQLLEVSPARVAELCEELVAGYAAEERGFTIARIAGGYRFQSHAELAPYVERFVLEGQAARLSSAALETLAIVAYKQPLSRAQIAAIRGVNVDGVIRTLQQRGYIEEVSRDPGPGQAILFGTTREFLERLGLDTLNDLPPIADFVPGADVVEALEHGLRAEPAERTPEPSHAEADPDDDTRASGPPAGGGERGPEEPVVDLIDVVDLADDDDRPGPEPPSWA
ncbi:MAG: scpB [Acidimicrobiales bacterium]|nr:scpB [Acidimicrobiales bacterium]